MVGKKNGWNAANVKYQLDTSLEEIQVSEELFQKTLLKIKNSEVNVPSKYAEVKELKKGQNDNKGSNAKGFSKVNPKRILFFTGSVVAAALLFIVIAPLIDGTRMNTDSTENELFVTTGIESETMDVEAQTSTTSDSRKESDLTENKFNESVVEEKQDGDLPLEATIESAGLLEAQSTEIGTQEFKDTHKNSFSVVSEKEQEVRTILEDIYQVTSIVKIDGKDKKPLDGLEIQTQLEEILSLLQNSEWKEANDEIEDGVYQLEFMKGEDKFQLELGDHLVIYKNGIKVYNYMFLYPEQMEESIKSILEPIKSE